jgi:hypothetical protein
MKSASKIVTANHLSLTRARNCHGFERIFSVSRERPTICAERNSCNVFLNPQTLDDLSWLTQKSQSEFRQLAPGCLFTNQRNLRAVFAKVCGNSEQERAATSYNYSRALDR